MPPSGLFVSIWGTLIWQQGELLNFNKRDFEMTNFTKTLVTGLILIAGAAGSAHAADNTFTASLKQDKSVSVEANYNGLKKQVRAVCKKEVERAGYSRYELTAGIQDKCEKTILAKVIKAADNFELTLVHNEQTGETIKTRAFAQN